MNRDPTATRGRPGWRSRARRGALLVACCLAAIAVAAAGHDGGPAARDALAISRDEHRPSLVFRNLGASATNGELGIAGLGDAAHRTLLPMRCDRVHYGAGRGLCVVRGAETEAGVRALVFDVHLRVRHEVELAGVPSRARVAPDGRYGAVTTFVEGHAYAKKGTFSTQTTLIDLRRGVKVGELEQFAVTRGGALVTAVDANYWGVTFARDSDRFYATLATGGRTYLIVGSVRQGTARTIHDNVECPSLSPDGTRIGYKQRVPGRSTWRLAVLDLRTMRETRLAETRRADDQVEWLDDDRLLYGVDGAIWMVAADGGGQPRRYAARAESPAVVRW